MNAISLVDEKKSKCENPKMEITLSARELQVYLLLNVFTFCFTKSPFWAFKQFDLHLLNTKQQIIYMKFLY